jgi:hypothetical protein
MKKLLLLIPIALFQLFAYADYTGVIKTNQTDLAFTTNMGMMLFLLKIHFTPDKLALHKYLCKQ